MRSVVIGSCPGNACCACPSRAEMRPRRLRGNRRRPEAREDAPIGARSSSPRPTAAASRPSRGPTCCATTPAGACAPGPGGRRRRWGSGARCSRCSQNREQRCWFHSQRPGRATKVSAPRREEGPGRDLGRRGQAARPRCGEGLRRRPPPGRCGDFSAGSVRHGPARTGGQPVWACLSCCASSSSSC
jgi:hypothetical protein